MFFASFKIQNILKHQLFKTAERGRIVLRIMPREKGRDLRWKKHSKNSNISGGHW